MWQHWLPILVIAFAGYYLGNINGAVCVSALLQDDVRKHGSGNAGLTNFVRNYGWGYAALVVIIDVSKAVLACLLGKLMLEPYGYSMEGTMVGAVAVSLGHDFPAFLGFRGGKGILCGISVAFALDWRCALIIMGVFAICFFTTGYVSLGSVMGALAFAISFGLFYWNNPFVAIGGIFIGLLAVGMHHANIGRLFRGTERKVRLFGKKKA
jgi:glycerol-3-phosphate acyltransferase PlsY